MNTHLLLSVLNSMVPGGRVVGVRVLFTVTVIRFFPENVTIELTSASNGRCPPS